MRRDQTAFKIAIFAAATLLVATPVASRDKLSPRTAITLIGELHGTQEIPRMFGNLVKLTATKKNAIPIAVGLELPISLQPGLDQAVRDRATCEQLRDRLFQSPAWQKLNDGRGSEAMLELLCNLVSLANQSQVSLFVFDTEIRERNETMAHEIASTLQRLKSAQAFILTGNLHASTAKDIPGFSSFHPMGWWLVQEGFRVRSFDVRYEAGEAWVCIPECSVHRLKSVMATPAIEAAQHIGYDDVIAVGRISASPPATPGTKPPTQ
jgi:hypothetical protein